MHKSVPSTNQQRVWEVQHHPHCHIRYIAWEKESIQCDHILTVVHAYNCTHSNATEFSLYYLMFSREPRIPIDLYYRTNTADLCASTSTKLAQQLERRLNCAYQKEWKVNECEQLRYKCPYGRGIRCAKLHKGNRVFLKCPAYSGKHKIERLLDEYGLWGNGSTIW